MSHACEIFPGGVQQFGSCTRRFPARGEDEMTSRLPFTSDQFFGVFAEYNRSFWLVALALWLVSVMALAGAWRNPRRWSGALMHLLATLWIWNAVAYHALLFTRINPAAWLFAALFTIEGVAVVPGGRSEPDRVRCP